MAEIHSDPQASHLGIERSYARTLVHYYWPSMYRDISLWIRGCEICQQNKVEQKLPIGHRGQRIIDEPWSVIAADVIGLILRRKKVLNMF